MRIIYVTPHLSTGGMPEYLRRKVELMKEENDVWVVEKHLESAYRSIRDKIENLIGDRLINIGNNHSNCMRGISFCVIPSCGIRAITVFWYINNFYIIDVYCAIII